MVDKLIGKETEHATFHYENGEMITTHHGVFYKEKPSLDDVINKINEIIDVINRVTEE